MTVKAVPHELALPSMAGIYIRPTPHRPASTIPNVAGLEAALTGKAAASHTHVAADLPVAVQKIFSGTGSPEGVVTAGVGSLYLRTDGGAGTTLYVKESGAGNTGWVGK